MGRALEAERGKTSGELAVHLSPAPARVAEEGLSLVGERSSIATGASLAFEIAKGADPPAVALPYEQAELRLLVTLCRELQRIAGTGHFFLDCRTGARLLNVDHTTVWRWMSILLVADGEKIKGSGAYNGQSGVLAG